MRNDSISRGRPRMPVYFLSIGGPNFIENKNHPAYLQLETIGKEITTRVNPKAVVVFSAHWQESSSKLKINAAEHTNIIYDFYGFPPEYYEIEYPYVGDPQIAEQVAKKLSAAGIQTESTERGLDHGIWVGFLAAFNPTTNPLNVPIVQVSLLATDDMAQHYRVGQALDGLRDEGVLIIGAGMAVHNLHDFRSMRARGRSETLPYVFSFDDGLKEAASADPGEREARMLALLKREDARKAHPTLEHLAPMYVAAGAGGSDSGEQVWTFPEGCLSWAQYRFGSVPAT